MLWLGRLLRRGTMIPHPFVYAVAADFLPKDRPLSGQDYREAVGKAIELANSYAAAVQKQRAAKR